MEWGYGWEMGPFRTMDAMGLDWLRAEMTKRGKSCLLYTSPSPRD